MKATSAVHTYIYGYDAPKETLMQRKRWFYNDKKKEQLLSFASGQTTELTERIHVISANIFEVFRNTALPVSSNSSEGSSQETNVTV